MINLIRCRIRFSLIGSAITALLGSRSSNHATGPGLDLDRVPMIIAEGHVPSVAGFVACMSQIITYYYVRYYILCPDSSLLCFLLHLFLLYHRQCASVPLLFYLYPAKRAELVHYGITRLPYIRAACCVNSSQACTPSRIWVCYGL